MKKLLRVLVVALVVVALIAGAAGGVRWARRGGSGARLLAGALMLALGMGVVVKPPQQGIEEAREDKGRKGGESGDPLDT